MLIRFNHVNLANNYVVGSTFRLNDKPCAAPSSLSRKQKPLLQGNYKLNVKDMIVSSLYSVSHAVRSSIRLYAILCVSLSL